MGVGSAFCVAFTSGVDSSLRTGMQLWPKMERADYMKTRPRSFCSTGVPSQTLHLQTAEGGRPCPGTLNRTHRRRGTGRTVTRGADTGTRPHNGKCAGNLARLRGGEGGCPTVCPPPHSPHTGGSRTAPRRERGRERSGHGGERAALTSARADA